MRLNYVLRRGFIAALLTLTLLTGFPKTIAAQSTITTGSISGTITDPAGGAASDVGVTLTDVTTGQRLALTTSATGLYSSGPLLPAVYAVHVEVKGFTTVDFPARVQVGTVVTANIRLQPASAGKDQRPASTTLVDTQQSTVAGVISSQQLENLPLNGRNMLDLAPLEPGVQIVDGAAIDPTQSGYFAVSIGGRLGRETRTLLDGIDITAERFGGATQNITASSIHEFQITQSLLDLSSPMTSSGTVNAVSRSGSNDYHGEAFYGFRDQDLGFAAFPGGVNPYFQRNQFGGNFGGALIQKKLFFFVDAQRTKQDSFSIPGLDYPFNKLSGGYNAPFRDNTALLRLDWVGSNVRVFYRATYDEASDIGPGNNYSPYLTHDNTPGQAVGVDFYRRAFTHSIRFGYRRYENHFGLPHEGGFLNPDPSLFIQNGALEVGPNPFAPQTTIQNSKQIRYDGSRVWKSHIVRFGGSFNRIDSGEFAAFGSLAPWVTTSATFANEAAILGRPTAYAAALMTGDPAGQLDNPANYPVASILISNGQGFFTENSGSSFPRGGQTDNRIDLYAGDTWKLSRKLVINYGLHYTRDSGLTNSDLAGVSQLNGFGPNLGAPVHQPNLDFAPQLRIRLDSL